MTDVQNSPTDRDQEQTKTQCLHCREPVDINSTDIFKSVSDQFWHEDCFAEYCYERRELVATPEGSFKIQPVVIKEIVDGSYRIIERFWRAECPVCHRTHETDEKAEDDRTDLVDTVTACCDTEWLPPADWIEDCEICGTSHRESRDCKPLSMREPFPDPDEHTYECSQCEWSGEADEFGNPDGYCPECDSAAVRALKVATDGGRDVQNSPTVSDVPACPNCETSEHVVEEPEAGYWLCRECGAPGSGSTEPIWWQNNPDSMWYVEGSA